MSLIRDYSGVVIDRNATAQASAALLTPVYTTFTLPADYARGEAALIPPLTGLQVFVAVPTGAADSASLAWTLDRLAGPLWVNLGAGTTTGTAYDGDTWLNIFFNSPLPISVAWLANPFRIGIQDSTGRLTAHLS